MRLAAVGIVATLLLLAVPLAPSPPAEAAGELRTFMTGLNWPVALAFSPDDRVFFAERFTGAIRVIDQGFLLAVPFFTLANTVTAGEQGLLGLALHPDFPTTPFVYAYHTFNNASAGQTYNRIVRLRATGNVGAFDRVILDRIPAAFIHNGGIIGFGPDGKLYAVNGDAAIPGLAQDLTLMHGKTFRIEPDGSVPSDNPFLGVPGANPYVYTYGHRNMFGLAFHPVTGRVYVTENGPACNDEVNLLVPGGNFGWGPTQTCATPPPPPQNTNRDGPNPILPIFWTGPPMLAPTNAAVYAGSKFPAFRNHLLMGDWNTRTLRRLELAAPNYETVVSQSLVLQLPQGILDVESGPDDAVWITTQSTIYRYVDTAQPPTASFTASPTRAGVGAPITFDASTSSYPDGTIVSYAWDFGDGTTDAGVLVTHAYTNPGAYDVRLTVVDNESYTDATVRQVTVNAPPQAAFSVSPTQGFIGTVFTFDGSASFDPDGTIANYAWTFGDGGTATGALATHGYAAKGGFTVTLTVTDADGATHATSRVVLVANRAPRITAADPVESQVVMADPGNRTISVTAVDDDGDLLTYVWRVNGAVVSGVSGAAFPFQAPTRGTYVVNVTVSDGQLSAWREWTVQVGSPEAAGGLPWIWVAAVVVAVLLALLVLLWRRRRKRA